MNATGRGSSEAFAAALAEAGYPDAYAGICGDDDDGAAYYTSRVPAEVAWRAYRVAGWASPCLACFLTRNRPTTDWAEACPERNEPGFPLDCGRTDKGEL